MVTAISPANWQVATVRGTQEFVPAAPIAPATFVDSENHLPNADLRRIAPRRNLPGTRAILGGALVVIATLGTYAAVTQTSAEEDEIIIIAAHDIAPGVRVQASDFHSVKMQRVPALAERVLHSTETLSGAITLGPLAAGDIVQTSAIASTTDTPYIEVSFSLPASHALNGALRSGETVDILATDKSSNTTIARTVATKARILHAQTDNNAIGKNGDLTITVGVNASSEAAAVAAAVDLGQVTLVRTTGRDEHEQ